MRFSAPRTAVVFVVLAGAMLLAGAGFGNSGEEKFEQIPLESIYVSGGGQPKVRPWGLDPDRLNEDDLLRFLKLRPTASNIFLVRARDETEASGSLIKLAGRAEIALPKKGEKSRLWLIVFFGFSNSDPTRWTVDSVEVSAKRIRMNYSLPERIVGGSPDSREYFALVPLNGLTLGKYDLEMRETRSKEITLMRKVLVTAAEK